MYQQTPCHQSLTRNKLVNITLLIILLTDETDLLSSRAPTSANDFTSTKSRIIQLCLELTSTVQKVSEAQTSSTSVLVTPHDLMTPGGFNFKASMVMNQITCVYAYKVLLMMLLLQISDYPNKQGGVLHLHTVAS